MPRRLRTTFAITVTFMAVGCGSSTDGDETSTTSNGGAIGIGGGASSNAGTTATIGMMGGSTAVNSATSDGTSTGGLPTSGGSPSGSGGATSLGGAASASGGSKAAGGSSATASTSAAGGSTVTCTLPSTFKWTGDGPFAQPKNGWVAMKDPTYVFHNNKHIIYYTTHDESAWGSGMMTFDTWSDAATATQTKTSFGVAPTLFYFAPKKIWVIAYQWGGAKFNYRTSTDPTNPSGWGSVQVLYNTALPSDGTGPIDQTVICNATKCYLYYAGDNGHIYKSSMPIANFPGTFPAAQDSGIVGTSQNLFEAVQVYTLKGSNKYLMIVEAQGSARYFRAWTATDLEGPWTLLTDNFAIKSNVTLSTNWTNDISHGDLIRTNPDETFTVDPCSLQFLIQGCAPGSGGDYGLLPYRLGVLNLVR